MSSLTRYARTCDVLVRRHAACQLLLEAARCVFRIYTMTENDTGVAERIGQRDAHCSDRKKAAACVSGSTTETTLPLAPAGTIGLGHGAPRRARILSRALRVDGAGPLRLPAFLRDTRHNRAGVLRKLRRPARHQRLPLNILDRSNTYQANNVLTIIAHPQRGRGEQARPRASTL